MEGFTYHNIFETKGLEYIFVILFLASLIPFWIILHRRSKRQALVGKAFSINPAALRIPQGVFFGPNHTWMHLLKNGIAKIGLDDMLMHTTGLVKINLSAEPGTLVKRGDLIAELNHEGNKLQILSPLTGEIRKANNSLGKHPEQMNNQPYSDGWMLEIKPSHWLSDTKACMLGEKASKWINDELLRFKDFVMTSTLTKDPQNSGVVLQDGGELIDHTLQKLPAVMWKDFQNKFLSLP